MPNGNSTPWMRARKDRASLNTSSILHHEILDLYDYLQPQKFENELRENMVEEIEHCVHSAIPGARVYFFGSFAAGTYLPEGDMDLVVLSRRYLDTGEPSIRQSFTALRKFGDALQRNGLVKTGSMAIISKARVPIIKYVDRRTGIRVDISFENESGVKANETYKKWKLEFPAMPILVTLVKQFLLMRSVSDVHTGGLGGFSTTCLIISLMQNMPHLTTGNMDAMQNLGEVFKTFLDYYGNKFNLEKTGIELEPPKLFQKASLAV